MRSWELSVLLFSAVALHGCLANTTESEIKEERSIREIVDLYNQGEGVTYLYDAVDSVPSIPLEEDEDSDSRGVIIKETVCLKSENPDLSQCDFKPDGEVKMCARDVNDEVSGDVMCVKLFKNARVKRQEEDTCNKVLCKLLKAKKNFVKSVIQAKKNFLSELF